MRKRLSLLFIFSFFSLIVFARLGGAGSDDDGGSSSSSSGSSDNSSSSDYSNDNGNSDGGKGGGVIMLILFSIFFIYGVKESVKPIFKKIKQRKNDKKLLLQSLMKNEFPDNKEALYFVNESEKDFKNKVVKSFYELQNAWANKTLALTRRYLSDGMYQKLQAQIDMMDHLYLSNKLSKIQMHGVHISRHYEEGDFLVIDVEVNASMSEKYFSSKFKNLNSKSNDRFTEYYTFIKKKNTSANLYTTTDCPSCGKPLPADMGDIARCSACSTICNSPEFDWILTEITQKEYYNSVKKTIKFPYENSIDKVNAYDVSKAYLEDMASNAYVKFRMAQAVNNFDKVKRYLSPEYFEKAVAINDEPYLYYRYYISNFDLKKMSLNDITKAYEADFYLREYFRRVKIVKGDLQFMDDGMYYLERCLTMSKSEEALKNPYLVHQHRCSSCGAPLENTTDLVCRFCNGTLNSTSADWVITGYYKVE